MARLEVQIAVGPLFQALRETLMQRLYSGCYIINSPDLVLDHVALGTVGPARAAIPASGNVTIPFQIVPTLVTTEAVIAANGMAAAPLAAPILTANLTLTINGTVLTANYGGIVHNTAYTALQQAIDSNLGPGKGQMILTQIETALTSQVGSSPYLSHDLKNDLPSELSSLTFGRSGLSANDKCLAVRLEVVANSDGIWQDFLDGTAIDDHLGTQDWSLFVSADAVVVVAKSILGQAVTSIGGTLNAVTWAPQGLTAATDASVSITLHVELKTLGITTFSGNVSVLLALTTTFTLEPIFNLGPQAVVSRQMRIDTSFGYTIQGGLGGAVENAIAHLFDAGDHIPVPAGYSKLNDHEFFKDTGLPILRISDSLSLGAQNIIGEADGMVISGPAKVVVPLAAPDCVVGAKPFVLQYITACSSIRDHLQQPATISNVTETASFFVVNSSPATQFPLVIGAVRQIALPVGTNPDPRGQFSPYLPSIIPLVSATGANYQVTIPGEKINPQYIGAPYPCQLMVLSNGGARYISLGPLLAPKINARTGVVENIQTLYIPDCHFEEIDPWVIMVAVFNPHYLVDPGPEGEVEQVKVVAGVIASQLLQKQTSGTTIINVKGVQVGTMATGSLAVGKGSSGAITDSSAEVAARLLVAAARLQPPAIRGAAEM